MNCPMVQPKISVESGEEMVSFARCTQGECAWWDATVETCAILSIEGDLAIMSRFLQRIAEGLKK